MKFEVDKMAIYLREVVGAGGDIEGGSGSGLKSVVG